jgi:hypothetical protein
MDNAFKTLPLACAVAPPTAAKPAVRFDFDNVAIGYREDYQDKRHQWHHWTRRSDAVAYRSHYQQNYRDMNFRDARNRGR